MKQPVILANTARDLAATNLRPATAPDGSTVLRPVGSPASQPLLRGYTPLGVIGTRLVLASGQGLVAIPLEAPAIDNLAPYTAPAPLPGSFRSFISATSTSLAVFTTAGEVTITIGGDGRPQWSARATRYPVISLMAADASPLSHTVAERRLSAVCDDGVIRSSDADALIGDLTDAYLALCDTARAAGLAIQPLLARYRLIAADGSVLFTSQPVLLAHSGGPQCTDAQSLYSADRQTIAAYTLTAGTWRLNAWCDAGSAPEVVRAEVYISPLFHPYNPSAQGSVTLTRATSSSQPFARVSLPGRGEAISAAGGRLTLMRAICQLDSIERLAAVIVNPFRAEPYIPDSLSIAFDTPAADVRRLAAAIAAPLPQRVSSASGSSFSAAYTAIVSGVAAYAGIDLVGAQACNPALFAAARTATSYRLSARVFLADGRCTGFDSEAVSGAFSALSPLVVCTLPDASALQIQLSEAGGSTRSVTLPLTPLPDGSASVYINDGILPIAIPDAIASRLPEAEPVLISRPATLAFASAAEPARILLETTVPDGELMALLPRMGTDSSWEFGRARFLLATRSAISSIAIDISRSRIAFRTLVDRGIDRPDAICPLPSGSVLAVVDGRIVEILPSGRTRPFADGDTFLALAWENRRRELWALRTDCDCTVFAGDHNWQYYTRNDISVNTFLSCRGALCAATESLHILGIETPATKAIEISRRHLPAAHSPFSLAGISLNATVSDIDATLDIWDCAIDGTGRWPLSSHTIRGALRSPLLIRHPAALRPCRNLDITLTATTSPDLTLHSLTIK